MLVSSAGKKSGESITTVCSEAQVEAMASSIVQWRWQRESETNGDEKADARAMRSDGLR